MQVNTLRKRNANILLSTQVLVWSTSAPPPKMTCLKCRNIL